MADQLLPKDNPRVLVIQKLYAHHLNKDAEINFPKHRYKKFIKDVVTGTIERKDLIQNIILDGELVDLTPRPSRKRDPDGWRVSSYSERINKKKTN